jgi:predicted PurR-regulated permease PerM
MNQPVRISYLIMAVLLVLVGWLHLGMLLLTALFGHFALHLFSLGRSKVLGLVVYLIAVAGVGAAVIYFSREAYVTLPQIADTTIPAVVEFAEKKGVQLPFTDYESLKTVALNEAREGIAGIGRYLRAATFQFVLLVAGLVVAASLFLNAPWGSEDDARTLRDSLYAAVVRELTARFKTFYRSFGKVMGAQLIISIINTGLTAVFLVVMGYPFTAVLVALTSLRPAAHHRQLDQQLADCRRGLHGLAQNGIDRAGLSGGHPQTGVFSQQ